MNRDRWELWGTRVGVSAIGIFLGYLVAIDFIPTSDDPRVRIALGVALGMAIGWVFTDNTFHPVVALAALVFLPTGITSARDMTMSGFLHPLIALFFAGLVVVEVVKANGGDLVVHAVLEHFKLGSRGTFIVLVSITALFSGFFSNTAVAAFMLPIVVGAMKVFNNPIVDRKTRIGVAYAATIGGLATPMGTPPNALAVDALHKAGITVTFTEWMTIGVPVAFVSLVIMTVMLLGRNFPNIKPSSFPYHIGWSDVRPQIGRLVISVLLFVTLAILWAMSDQKAWKAWQPFFWIPVAVFMVAILVPVKGQSLLHIRKLFAWSFAKECWILLLFGGGIALGTGLKSAGGDKWMAAAMLPLFLILPPFWRILSTGATLTFVGELLSNTAMAALFLPVLIASAPDLGIDAKIIGITMGLCCSHGYTLLIATPPNGLMASGLGKEEKEEYRMTMLMHGPVLNVILVTVAVTMVWWLVK